MSAFGNSSRESIETSFLSCSKTAKVGKVETQALSIISEEGSEMPLNVSNLVQISQMNPSTIASAGSAGSVIIGDPGPPGPPGNDGLLADVTLTDPPTKLIYANNMQSSAKTINDTSNHPLLEVFDFEKANVLHYDSSDWKNVNLNIHNIEGVYFDKNSTDVFYDAKDKAVALCLHGKLGDYGSGYEWKAEDAASDFVTKKINLENLCDVSIDRSNLTYKQHVDAGERPAQILSYGSVNIVDGHDIHQHGQIRMDNGLDGNLWQRKILAPDDLHNGTEQEIEEGDQFTYGFDQLDQMRLMTKTSLPYNDGVERWVKAKVSTSAIGHVQDYISPGTDETLLPKTTLLDVIGSKQEQISLLTRIPTTFSSTAVAFDRDGFYPLYIASSDVYTQLQSIVTDLTQQVQDSLTQKGISVITSTYPKLWGLRGEVTDFNTLKDDSFEIVEIGPNNIGSFGANVKIQHDWEYVTEYEKDQGYPNGMNYFWLRYLGADFSDSGKDTSSLSFISFIGNAADAATADQSDVMGTIDLRGSGINTIKRKFSRSIISQISELSSEINRVVSDLGLETSGGSGAMITEKLNALGDTRALRQSDPDNRTLVQFLGDPNDLTFTKYTGGNSVPTTTNDTVINGVKQNREEIDLIKNLTLDGKNDFGGFENMYDLWNANFFEFNRESRMQLSVDAGTNTLQLESLDNTVNGVEISRPQQWRIGQAITIVLPSPLPAGYEYSDIQYEIKIDGESLIGNSKYEGMYQLFVVDNDKWIIRFSFRFSPVTTPAHLDSSGNTVQAVYKSITIHSIENPSYGPAYLYLSPPANLVEHILDLKNDIGTKEDWGDFFDYNKISYYDSNHHNIIKGIVKVNDKIGNASDLPESYKESILLNDGAYRDFATKSLNEIIKELNDKITPPQGSSSNPPTSLADVTSAFDAVNISPSELISSIGDVSSIPGGQTVGDVITSLGDVSSIPAGQTVGSVMTSIGDVSSIPAGQTVGSVMTSLGDLTDIPGPSDRTLADALDYLGYEHLWQKSVAQQISEIGSRENLFAPDVGGEWGNIVSAINDVRYKLGDGFSNIDTVANAIQPLWKSTYAELAATTPLHGQIAHVHETERMYFGHSEDGLMQWVPLANKEETLDTAAVTALITQNMPQIPSDLVTSTELGAQISSIASAPPVDFSAVVPNHRWKLNGTLQDSIQPDSRDNWLYCIHSIGGTDHAIFSDAGQYLWSDEDPSTTQTARGSDENLEMARFGSIGGIRGKKYFYSYPAGKDGDEGHGLDTVPQYGSGDNYRRMNIRLPMDKISWNNEGCTWSFFVKAQQIQKAVSDQNLVDFSLMGGQYHDVWITHWLYPNHSGQLQLQYRWNSPQGTVDKKINLLNDTDFINNFVNEWHHLVIVQTTTHLKVYLDGGDTLGGVTKEEKVDEVEGDDNYKGHMKYLNNPTYNTPPTDPHGYGYAGTYGSSEGGWWFGVTAQSPNSGTSSSGYKFADICIWNKALSDDEVNKHINNVGYAPSTDLISY